MVRSLFLAFVALTASRKMFNDMLASVLRAPMSFFDTTPVGRLVNRFSKDVYTIDEKLVETAGMYLRTLFNIIATIAVISGVTPVFILFLIPMILYYMNEQAFFTVSYAILLFAQLFQCFCLSNGLSFIHCLCLLYTSPSPRDVEESRMPSSA